MVSRATWMWMQASVALVNAAAANMQSGALLEQASGLYYVKEQGDGMAADRSQLG